MTSEGEDREARTGTADVRLLVYTFLASVLLSVPIALIDLYVVPAISQSLNSLVVSFNVDVPTVSPSYRPGTRLEMAPRLMQVAVLYFAVIVAAFRFMDSSSRFDAENDKLLFLVVLLALLFVSVSAFLAVVASLKIFTQVSFVWALLFTGLSFILSCFAPVLALASESRGREETDPVPSTNQKESARESSDEVSEGAHDSTRHTVREHGRGYGAGFGWERED
ncbi:hypothetical protein [Halobaculum sp. MBLA0143]|uniref:hypothetical protein n=1 Tax=Halobaculum sp. MBLA0143 TaxID=3079933 RepID=UPI003525572E